MQLPAVIEKSTGNGLVMIDDMLAESHKSIVQRIPVPDVGYQLVQCLLGDRGNARQKQPPQGL